VLWLVLAVLDHLQLQTELLAEHHLLRQSQRHLLVAAAAVVITDQRVARVDLGVVAQLQLLLVLLAQGHPAKGTQEPQAETHRHILLVAAVVLELLRLTKMAVLDFNLVLQALQLIMLVAAAVQFLAERQRADLVAAAMELHLHLVQMEMLEQ
jgi:hypothetical protein